MRRGPSAHFVGLASCSKAPRYEMSVDGGRGQYYNLLIAAAIRLKGAPLALYHHSTSYIVSHSRLAGMLMFVAGSDTLHVMCSERMFSAMQARYPSARNHLIVSNAVWLDDDVTEPEAPLSETIRLGYLSAITEEKGVLRAIETLDELLRRGLDATLTIAGAGCAAGIVDRIRESEVRLAGRLDYRGEVSSLGKSRMLSSIDYLLFPSLYPHETQSSVVPEALYASVPVIAFDHRYVGELLGEAGLLVSPDKHYAVEAASYIASGTTVADRRERKLSAREQGIRVRDAARGQLEALLGWLTTRGQ
jgi:glycosyltransferase involved in cell wall biosynthesis